MNSIIKSVSQFSEIREWFSDEQSREIYDGIVFYNYTKNYEYLHQIIKKYCRSKEDKDMDLCDLIEQNKNEQKDDIVIFGASGFGEAMLEILNQYHIKVSAFCDNDLNKVGKKICGVPIVLPEQAVKEKPNAKFLVSVINWHIKMAMKKELLKKGIDSTCIILALSYYGNQYFESELMIPDEGEVFIDGGSLDCVTCKMFSDWADGKYKEILSFEPDSQCYQLCLENKEKFGLHDTTIYPYGLWDEKTILSFTNSFGGSCINETGGSKIHTISIDEVLDGRPCTFIKMDIEGAELKALIGAKETIRKYHPKLAISIYHKPEDMIEIPSYIRGLSADYRLYLRHHSSVQFETILYAI